ncbi:MAG TPA: glycosyltransferase [Candidatus Didemnitutus sp.]|nr:glycosyltransferase [Candidatus Didemnitutus sp.]
MLPPFPSSPSLIPPATRAKDQLVPGPLEALSAPPDIERCEPRTPLVTVAIPAYKRADLLQQALLSLAFQEDFHDFEVIVCDDLASTATRDVVANCALPRLRLFANPQRLGAVGNWNRCLQLATGRWITVLHEDDVLYPWFFRLVAPRLRSGLAAVVTRCVQGEQLQPVARPRTDGPVRRYPPPFFLKSSMTPFPGVVFSTALGRELGGFNEHLGPLADYDFWYRLACAGPVEVVRQTGAFYRLHQNQWTVTAWPDMLRKMHLLRLRIAREQFPRRPALGRWLARFFTYRSALSYQKRFQERPAVLQRVRQFKRMTGHALPSGWVWQALQRLTALASSRPTQPLFDSALDSSVVAKVSSAVLPSVTVAVCTHNRAELLREALAGIVEQDYPADRLEVLVVDNVSTDHTPTTVANFSGARFPLRRIFERQQGLNHARNRAIAEARGSIVVFADDDILVESDWIRQLVAPFVGDGRERIGCVAGEVIPVFPQGRPDWVAEWHGPLAFRTRAGRMADHQNPMGANFAVRRNVLMHTGNFAGGLDRTGDNFFGGGDRELVRRIRSAGWQVWFAPAAAVRHQMPASRTTFAYAARHAFDSARSRVFERVREGDAAGYLLSRLVANVFKAGGFAVWAVLQFPLGRIDSGKKSLVRGWRSCGYLYEAWRSLTMRRPRPDRRESISPAPRTEENPRYSEAA